MSPKRTYLEVAPNCVCFSIALEPSDLVARLVSKLNDVCISSSEHTKNNQFCPRLRTKYPKPSSHKSQASESPEQMTLEMRSCGTVVATVALE